MLVCSWLSIHACLQFAWIWIVLISFICVDCFWTQSFHFGGFVPLQILLFLVTIKNKKMNKNTAITKFCNFGKTIFGNKSRRSKFFGTGCFEGSVPYQPGCKNSSKPCQRRTIRKGDSLSATFVPKKAKRPLRCLGTILSMSVSASKKGNCRSRRIPAASICPYHDDSARFWVKTAEGRVLNCKRIVLSNPRKRSAFLLSYSDWWRCISWSAKVE